MEETKITGHLPNMMLELSHRAEPDGSAEHMVLRLTATPDFQSALPLLKQAVGPTALLSLWQAAPVSANPFLAAWTGIMQQCLAPWLGAMSGNPFLPSMPSATEKPSDRHIKA